METIRFSYDWNNKPTNAVFTTLWLHNPAKYQRGGRFGIECNGQLRGIAELKAVRTLKISALNELVAFLDTGYIVPETVKLLQTMYKNKCIDWNAQKLDFCLFVWQTDKKAAKNARFSAKSALQ
jgi:hypothetical protein